MSTSAEQVSKDAIHRSTAIGGRRGEGCVTNEIHVGQQHAPAAVPATKQHGHGKIIKNSAMAPKSDQTQEQRESGGLQRIPIEAKLFKRIPKDHVRQKI